MNLKNIGKVAVLFMALPFLAVGADAAKAAEAQKLNDQAVALMQKGDLAGALQGFQNALKADRTCLDAVHNLGKLLIVGKDYANARKLLQASYSLNPQDVGIQIQLAQLAALENKEKEYRAWIGELAKKKDVELLKSLSVQLDRQGSSAAADVAVDAALSLDPNDAEAWFNKGLVAQGRKNWMAAAGCYRKSTDLNPRNADAWVNLGNMCDNAGKPEEALVCYEKALAVEAKPLTQYSVARKVVFKDPRRGLDLLKAAMRGKGPGVAEARTLMAKLAEAANKAGGAK